MHPLISVSPSIKHTHTQTLHIHQSYITFDQDQSVSSSSMSFFWQQIICQIIKFKKKNKRGENGASENRQIENYAFEFDSRKGWGGKEGKKNPLKQVLHGKSALSFALLSFM